MSILSAFDDFEQSTATFKELSTTNIDGEGSEVWTTVATCSIWMYIASSGLTDQQGKLQIIDVDTIIYNPEELIEAAGETFDLTKTLKATVGGVDYHVEGKNNILNFDEVVVLSVRKDT